MGGFAVYGRCKSVSSVKRKKKLISMTHKEIVDVDFKSMCLYKFL